MADKTSVPVCFFHGPEPDMPGDFRACGECLHVFRTEAEIMHAYRRYGIVAERFDDSVHASCPLCTHDW